MQVLSLLTISVTIADLDLRHEASTTKRVQHTQDIFPLSGII